MRRVTRNGVIAVAAASGAMALTVPAYADAGAAGSAAGSPGVLSGNTVQLPVHVPVNVCGNTVNVVGVLNPAVGNSCANEGRGGDRGGEPDGAAAESSGKGSPGVLSGNSVQLPVHVPANVSGNSVNVVGVGNPSTGNESVNTPGDRPERPGQPVKPAPEPSAPPRTHPEPKPAPHAPSPGTGSLAHTGTDRTVPVLAASAALLVGGVVLRRRFRPGTDG